MMSLATHHQSQLDSHPVAQYAREQDVRAMKMAMDEGVFDLQIKVAPGCNEVSYNQNAMLSWLALGCARVIRSHSARQAAVDGLTESFVHNAGMYSDA